MKCPPLITLMPNGLGVFLKEQINELIDARGSYRVLALIRLNSALAQGEVISQYDHARFEQLPHVRFASLFSRCQDAVLYQKHRDAIAAFLQRHCSVGQKRGIR